MIGVGTAYRAFVSQYLFPEAVALLREAELEVDVRAEDTPLVGKALRERVQDADSLVCLFTDRVDRELLEAAPRLSVVANVAVGFDNVDVAAATELVVAVTKTPGVLTDATADLAFALILATARRIPEGDAFLRAGRNTHWKLDQHVGSATASTRRRMAGMAVQNVLHAADGRRPPNLVHPDVYEQHPGLRDGMWAAGTSVTAQGQAAR